MGVKYDWMFGLDAFQILCSSCESGTRHTVGIYPVNLASGWQFTVKPLQMNALKTSILLLPPHLWCSGESLITDQRNLWSSSADLCW